jgi:NDP-sugar pyrophosphorylase family protein
LIEPGAFIKSPTILGDQTEVRHGAYIRGNCLIGRNCVVGHVTELKHTIFLDGAKAGHFAYLGDSILGNRVNLGAGTKLANLRFIKGDVSIATSKGMIKTGLRKLGAILGDQVQTGCNSVTNPGVLLGKKSMVIPNTTVPSGYHPDSSLIR